MAWSIDGVRAAQDAGVALLFGCQVFRLVVLRTASSPIERGLRRLEVLGLALALITGIAWLGLTAADMASVPLGAIWTDGALGAVLGDTDFGRIAEARFALSIGIAALLLYRRHKSTPPLIVEAALLLGAAGLLVSLAWIGHAGASTGTDRAWQLGADIVHLGAMGAWLGSLPGLILVLLPARAADADPGRALARRAVHRFSNLGMASVALLVASGLMSAWYQVGTIPALVGTAYGQVLLVKLALFGAMLVCAAINRYGLAPRLAATPGQSVATFGRLLRNTAIETVLGLAVLGAVGVLVGGTPAAHEQPVWPFPYTLDWSGVVPTPAFERLLVAAGVLALAGFVVALWGLRRRVWWMIPAGLCLASIAIAWPAPTFLTEAYPTSYFHSPVDYTAASIAQGEPLYQANCASCHGPFGYGDGPLAGSLAERPADLTGIHLIHHGVGTLFWWIGHGMTGTPMPGFANRLEEDRIWDVINYLRAQEEAERSNRMDGNLEPFWSVAAPDFAFQRPGGDQETLIDQRGKASVLVVLYSLPGSLPRLRALQAAELDFARREVRIVALPMDGSAVVASADLGGSDVATIAADANPNGVAAYTLYRRVPTGEGVLPVPAHMEFLIDRAGYLRARWMAGENGWSEVPDLLRKIEALNREPARPSAAAYGHVH